ncbi:MAG: M55 family metallopeptidase [Armatimonadetes bacterium]|nr:M55 family metallopeptidase [Armatimonadota bacterium]MDW8121484.1 M55 family metallopeptidase [Armatimonadota bacterium]
MRLMIWVDAEGISGVVNWSQVLSGRSDYQEGRLLMTKEVNSFVRGARRAGSTALTVVDCHGAGGDHSFRNLIPELLEEGAEYVLGARWTSYRRPLEEGCDGAVFIGFHARAGIPDGVLSHTVSGDRWLNFYINGQPCGEIAICAALCGHYQVPVLMVTGDVAACEEAKQALGESVRTLAVKKGLSRSSAVCLPPHQVWQKMEEMAYQIVSDPPKVAPFRPSEPTTLTVELTQPEFVRDFLHGPVRRVNERTVEVTGENFLDAWKVLWGA